MQVEKSGLEEVCKGKDELVSSLADECATLKGRLEGKTEETEGLQAHNWSLQAHVKTVEVRQIWDGVEKV